MPVKIKFFLSTILLGILFYVPNDVSLSLPIFICFILSFFYKFNIQKVKVSIGSPFFSLFFIVFYALVIILFQRDTDIFFIKTLMKIIIIATGIKVMIEIFHLTFYQNLLSVCTVLMFNVFISLIQYFNLFGLSQWALSLNTIFIKHEIYFKEFRAMGLLGGYDSNGIIMAFSFHILLILALNENNVFRKRAFLGFSLLNLLAIFIASRVGILAAALGTFLLLCQMKKKLSQKVAPYARLIFPMIIIISCLYFWGPKSTQLSTLEFIFEPFIKYNKYGEFWTQSTDGLLKEHYKLPRDSKTLIFGNGYDNANPVYGANTDVGYLQIIFGLGIIGLVFIIVVYFYWAKIIRNNIARSPPGLYQDMNYFSLNYIIIIFINSFKGPYFLAYTLIYLFSFTFLLSLKFKPEYCPTNSHGNEIK